MLELKKTAALGMAMSVLLLAGTSAQASAQATQDSSKATTQDTSAYSAPQAADTGAPADTSAIKAGEDTSGMSKMANDSTANDSTKMGHDSAWTDTSKTDKAWKKNTDSTESK